MEATFGGEGSGVVLYDRAWIFLPQLLHIADDPLLISLFEIVIQRGDVIRRTQTEVIGAILPSAVVVGEEHPFLFLHVNVEHLLLGILQRLEQRCLCAFFGVFIPTKSTDHRCDQILLCHVPSTCS